MPTSREATFQASGTLSPSGQSLWRKIGRCEAAVEGGLQATRRVRSVKWVRRNERDSEGVEAGVSYFASVTRRDLPWSKSYCHSARFSTVLGALAALAALGTVNHYYAVFVDAEKVTVAALAEVTCKGSIERFGYEEASFAC